MHRVKGEGRLLRPRSQSKNLAPTQLCGRRPAFPEVTEWDHKAYDKVYPIGFLQSSSKRLLKQPANPRVYLFVAAGCRNSRIILISAGQSTAAQELQFFGDLDWIDFCCDFCSKHAIPFCNFIIREVI